jgi:hypothetical protein
LAFDGSAAVHLGIETLNSRKDITVTRISRLPPSEQQMFREQQRRDQPSLIVSRYVHPKPDQFKRGPRKSSFPYPAIDTEHRQ